MCGLLGVVLRNPSETDLQLAQQLILEASVRGLHATGLAWISGSRIQISSASKPARTFLNEFGSLDQCIGRDGNLYLVAHLRYSTSDLAFNQPLGDERFAIIHNGVVSQEDPKHWKRLYGYQCKTRNDSELLLQALRHRHSPLDVFPDCSAAVIELHSRKRLRFYRNGKRPLYFAYRRNGAIVCSTQDIGRRCGIAEMIRVPAGDYVTVNRDGSVKITEATVRLADLQRVA